MLMISPPQPRTRPIFQNVIWEHSPLPQIGNLVIVNQTFGLSHNQSSGVLEQVPYDGLLGLAYPSLAVQGTTPVFDNLKNQGVISEPVFTFYLSS